MGVTIRDVEIPLKPIKQLTRYESYSYDWILHFDWDDCVLTGFPSVCTVPGISHIQRDSMPVPGFSIDTITLVRQRTLLPSDFRGHLQ